MDSGILSLPTLLLRHLSFPVHLEPNYSRSIYQAFLVVSGVALHWFTRALLREGYALLQQQTHAARSEGQ
jgi:hypothetical protein